jgi:hypothetical protein
VIAGLHQVRQHDVVEADQRDALTQPEIMQRPDRAERQR